MAERIIVIDTNRSGYSIEQVIDNTLTVDELIEELRYLPGDCKVVFRNDGGYTYGHISDRDIDSEYYEPEPEEEDDVLSRDDMIYEIGRECEKQESRTAKLSAVWDDECNVEFLSVGYNDSRVLGVATDGEDFIPIEDLSDNELEEVWYAVTV